MNTHLENIIRLLQDAALTEDKKQVLLKAVAEADKEWAITDFKLDRTEKVKRTTAILLEETIEELEQKRKAVEAQNRELEIETALERVRARTMAMQKSKELKEVIKVVYEQFVHLNILIDHTGFIIDYKARDDMNIWLADRHEVPSQVTIPYFDCAHWNSFNEAKEKGTDFFANHLSFEEKNKFYQELFKLFPVPDEAKEYYFSCPGLAISTVLLENVGLYIENFSGVPYTDEENNTLMRFGNVFQQTYTRFLDLQKAEAQAKEAKIEAALERTRTQSMIMQHSNELDYTLRVFHEQVLVLGINSAFSFLWLPDEKNERHVFWAAWAEDKNGLTVFKSKAINYPLDRNEPATAQCFVDWKSDEPVHSYHVQPGEVENYFAVWKELLEGVEHLKPGYFPGGLHYVEAFMKYGCFGVMVTTDLTEDEKKLLNRFAIEFERTYTRFLDLQKAEAQAREAQIELALERVRARAMAMQNSDELSGLVAVLFEELTKLNLILYRCIIWIFNPDTLTARIWMANSEDKENAESYYIKKLDHPYYNAILKGWKERNPKWVYDLHGKDKKSIDELLLHETELSRLPQSVKAGILSSGHTIVSGSFNNFGLIEASGPVSQSEEQLEILHRFGKVFDLTYTRFNDLKQAEAQAKEAQIEVALERVRSKAMAMHKSEDLNGAVATVFEELDKLGLGMLRCGIAILDKEKPRGDIWITVKSDMGNTIQVSGDEPLDIHPLLKGAHDAWLKQEDFSYVLQHEELFSYYQAITKTNFQFPISATFNTEKKDQQQYYFNAVFQDGSLFAFLDTAFTDEAKIIMKRFANVFSLTYKRFLDLQKAEANAREARIEAGLERVRSRTMAMHSSDDVSAATGTMFTELEKLGIENLRCGIANIRSDQTMEVWSVNNTTDGKIVKGAGIFDMNNTLFWQHLYLNWDMQKDFSYYFLSGKEKEDYVKTLNATPNYLSQPIGDLPDMNIQCYYFAEGAVWTFSLQPHSEEDKQVMKRFASVFSLTFRRYQDLKNAEAQAREAKIEAALERVRGNAMAMHNSKDLAATIGVFYRELETFSITPRRCGVGILNKENRTAELSTMNTTEQGDSVEIIGTLKMQGHPILEAVYDNWLLQKEYHPVLRGNEIKEYYGLLRPQIEFPDYPNDAVQYGYFFFFSEGGVYAWTEKEMSEDELQIYRRFTTVLSLTYKRYIDLKKAEANAKEAIKQAALDRIRADIASMRTVSDLDRITPLVWNELTILGVPFIRCGVFIMDDAQELIHTFLSTPEGKAIAAFHLPYDTPGNISQVLVHWRNNQNYIDHWDESSFTELAGILVRQKAIVSPEQYLNTIPHGGFFLHFLPFLQGMLYVGNTSQLSEEEINLIQSVADAFSTAYARYEDFNKLEAAKQQVEKTLVDLKQAQAQLVQSEKMASLGELTAGIAHEIQNPLNFVNNFSEVNKELLAEMKEEIDKGNMEEAKTLANDVIDNQEKINHHGKRADAIVKGMLQHSRSSSSAKEATNINTLTDEYLRLAYHGLRAKNKAFNATMKTDFDESIGNINIIPQDIGRVILNLITNAFYAVTEKKKQQPDGYEPIVSVSTEKINGKVKVSVKDNGNGIPQKVLDKIFQPFFTTKPTGQGTGLGLSLSYDIVKAHGGAINVKTEENKGSEFIIILPL